MKQVTHLWEGYAWELKEALKDPYILNAIMQVNAQKHGQDK